MLDVNTGPFFTIYFFLWDWVKKKTKQKKNQKKTHLILSLLYKTTIGLEFALCK